MWPFKKKKPDTIPTIRTGNRENVRHIKAGIKGRVFLAVLDGKEIVHLMVDGEISTNKSHHDELFKHLIKECLV